MNAEPVEQPEVEPHTLARRPTLRVVRGDATPEEIAAILAVVSRRSTPAAEDRLAQSRSRWTDRAAQLGTRPSPGPGSWRASAGTF